MARIGNLMTIEEYREAVAKKAKKNKYLNRKTVVDGIEFASQREAKRWCELKLLKLSGEIGNLRRQVTYHLIVNDQLICKYIADFVYVKTGDGWTTVEDAKGLRTQAYRIKRRLMKAIQGIDIVEV